jgi:glutaredoxin
MSAKIPLQDSSSNISELYITQWCSACHVALDKLKEAKIEFEVIDVDEEQKLRQAFKVWEKRLGYNPNSIPQFWYKGQHIGGSKNIDKFLKEQNVN